MGHGGGDLAPRLLHGHWPLPRRWPPFSETGLPQGSGQRPACLAPRPRTARRLPLLSPLGGRPPAGSGSTATPTRLASLQVTLLSVEMTALKEERDRLRVTSEDKEPKEQLQKAVRDRDEAIAK